MKDLKQQKLIFISLILALAIFSSFTGVGVWAADSPSAASDESALFKHVTLEKEPMTFMLAPQLGLTSYSLASGDTKRDAQFSYGVDAFLMKKKVAIGLSFDMFKVPSEGSPALNFSQDMKWLEAQVRYRIWDENFAPYVLGGAGVLFQTVTSQVMGNREDHTGIFGIYDMGVGFHGLLSESVAMDLGLTYYQYSNVNGFRYFLSVGYLFGAGG